MYRFQPVRNTLLHFVFLFSHFSCHVKGIEFHMRWRAACDFELPQIVLFRGRSLSIAPDPVPMRILFTGFRGLEICTAVCVERLFLEDVFLKSFHEHALGPTVSSKR